MQEYLMFTLRGPMQSWGTSSAVGEVRGTAGHPGRSGVVGLLAAALGLRRSQTEELKALHNAVRLAVRGDRCGERMIDYHTVQAPPAVRNVTYYTRRDELVNKVSGKGLSTVLSAREYLVGAMFTVCLWLEGDCGRALKELRDALVHPRFVLYLGRKACPPGFPLIPEVVAAGNVAEALEEYDRARNERCGSLEEHGDAQVWSDEGHCVADVEGRAVQYSVRDVLTNPEKRQFAVRRECHFSLNRPKETDHVHEQD